MSEVRAIATVVSVIGKAYVRTPEGEVRQLQSGDMVREGEQIVTSADGRVQLDFGNSSGMEISNDQVVTLSNELIEDLWPDENQAALADSTVDRVIEALEQGREIDDLLEAPAAGGNSTASEGNSFVRLQRIIEETDPLTFDFPTNTVEELPADDGFTDSNITIDPVEPPAPIVGPTASITLDANITLDDIIDAAEAGQNIAISGTTAGDVAHRCGRGGTKHCDQRNHRWRCGPGRYGHPDRQWQQLHRTGRCR
jgi:hypothetical protein